MPDAPTRGVIGIRAFDEGIVLKLRSQLTEIDRDGRQVMMYAVEVPGVKGPPGYNGLVPVVFVEPEAVYEPKIVPEFVVRPGDPTPALERFHSVGRKYRVPSPKAKKHTVELPDGTIREGWSEYIERERPWPFDMPYDVGCVARRRNSAVRMFEYLLRLFKPYGSVTVLDSDKNKQTFECFMEGTASVAELLGVAERFQGWTLSLRVAGMLDLTDETEAAAVRHLPEISVAGIGS